MTIQKSQTTEKPVATEADKKAAIKRMVAEAKADVEKSNKIKGAGAVKPKPVKTTQAKQTPVKADASIELPTVKKLRNETAIVQLNHVYGQLNPGARPVFGQVRFTPIKAPHTTLSATTRDDAFFRSIKNVYGTKPFTQYEIGADTGNMARSLGLKRIELTGESDDLGHAFYRLVA